MRIWPMKHVPYLLSIFLILCAAAALRICQNDLATAAEDGSLGAAGTEEPIFENWPKPQLALLLSGAMDGYLEPCGCSGLENQKGGLKRRHTLIRQLQADGWPVVALDLGGQVRRPGVQAEIKYRYAIESLIELGYEAIGFGIHELQLSSEAVLYTLANLDQEKNPLISANVGVFGFNNGFSARYRVIEAAGKRIGVTAVLGREHRLALQGSKDVTWMAPEQALRDVLPKLQVKDCDLLVLMVHGEPEEAKQLAQQFPQFGFVTCSGADEPLSRPRTVEGAGSQLIEVGHKGMYVMVVGVYDDPEQPFRIQRVPLDHRFADSDAMQSKLVAYQNDLEQIGLDGLGLTGVKHPGGSFVGSAVCADCHTEADEVFQNTPHAHATETLQKLDPPRHLDPECLSCHATGWNPQKYFPYSSGFLGLKETPHLVANGCENCHGPGGDHAAAESGDEDVDDAELERLRSIMRREIVENEGNRGSQVPGSVVKNCQDCHDLDNSPDFDFQEYWPKVEHYGKD